MNSQALEEQKQELLNAIECYLEIWQESAMEGLDRTGGLCGAHKRIGDQLGTLLSQARQEGREEVQSEWRLHNGRPAK